MGESSDRTSAQVNDPAIGEDGRAEAHAVGGEAYTLNINAYLVGNVPPIGTKVTVTIKNQTSSGAITQVKPSVGNRAYGKATITATGFEGIPYESVLGCGRRRGGWRRLVRRAFRWTRWPECRTSASGESRQSSLAKIIFG